MKKFLFALLLMVVLPVYASHIVGGEFELIHISGSTYRLNLIYYFDKKNGLKNPNGSQSLPEVVDPTLTATIFRKSDNKLITSLVLTFKPKEPVNYTQPACASGDL